MKPLTPDLKMYPHLIMCDDGLHFIISERLVYAVDAVAALELASADGWLGSEPIWAYRGTDVHKAITEFRKILEE